MAGDGGVWTLLTGHGYVSVAIVENPQARVRDLPVDAGPAERATQAIVTDLEGAGCVTRRRVVRRTGHTVHGEHSFWHQRQDGFELFVRLPVVAGGSWMPP
jgi:hypothetical protein